ncbi:hypothetical protein RQN30_03575 [Arcanobacterium hippocoleae]
MAVSGSASFAYRYCAFRLSAFWLFVPWYRREYEIAAQNQRLARGLTQLPPHPKSQDDFRRWLLIVAICLAASALFFIATVAVPSASGFNLLLPLLILLIGAGIIWSVPLDKDQQAEESDNGELSAVRKVIAAIGGGISVIGGVLLVSEIAPRNPLFLGLTTAFVTILTLSVVLYPIYLRLKFSLRQTAVHSARESVRADMAAHLHDSVLQSLALIRSRANDPEAVRTLARMQEQDLRKYLYSERTNDDTSTAELLRSIASEIERRYQKEISCVVSGDCTPDSSARSVIAAAREALTNACKHGGGAEISLYAELRGRDENSDQKNNKNRQSIDVWIRDRGPGFDPSQVPADRAGIRDSIIGRMERIGGKAALRSPLPSGGTEIHLEYHE